MFTIKATYHGHTRKHTFSDTKTFPTYDQICHQLHRVFPITQNYYLSKLLFSPDAAQCSRILLSKDVHNAFDYHKCIRQFKDRTWPHALLRFTVLDEVPLNSHLNNDVQMLPAETCGPTLSASSLRSMSVAQRPAAPSFMKQSVPFHMPMEVDTLITESNWSSANFYPQHTAVPMPQRVSSSQATSICCSVSQGKAEIKTILHNFQEDLNRVMTINFDQPLPPTSVSHTSAPPPFFCSVCAQHLQGAWYSCENCHVVVCEACHNATRSGLCLRVMNPHQMKLVSSPNSDSYVPIPRLPSPWIPRSESSDMTGILNTSFVPTTSASTQTGETPSTLPAPPAPVIHNGILCDVCNKTIEGIRHKCLDCPDYDLCTSCITPGVSEIHNPFHEFFEINEPGRVIVHTVFSGNGEGESQGTPNARSRAAEASAAPATGEPVIHYANCDLCDSRISGDRYKCLDCPDFDTCVTCFTITNEQHPDHAFVKIQKKEDFIRRRNIHAMHNATCNGCSKRIFGLRFKCMHPECPDYDLCGSCEAFPIAVHPGNHPMLKMKTPDTVIPTVYRVGQKSIIESTSVVNERQTSTDTLRSPESTPSDTVSRMPSAAPPVPAPVLRSIYDRSSSPVGDEMMRSKTPCSFFDHLAFEKEEVCSKETPVEQSLPLPPLPPPKLPPKPDMISHPSWASIPGFFNPAPRSNMSPPLPVYKTDGNNQFYFGTLQGLAQPAIPAEPVLTPLHVAESVPTPQITPKDNNTLLPSVPNHTPNPWPTTNPTERQELLELIDKLSVSFVPEPARGLVPVPELPVATPQRNNPFLSPPPSTTVELPRVIIPPPVERPTALESQESRALTNDPLPSWASLTPDISHLVRENLERPTEAKPASVVSEPASVIGSPLSGQALLNRPTSSNLAASSYPRSLAELIHQLPALIPSKIPSPEQLPEAREPLTAKFVDDVTVFDGQAFPPGAEFIKGWRLLNTSERDWPENTELVFVAGDPLSDSASSPVPVGKVATGDMFDVWTGELKAPDVPGRYVGYWRLKADGKLFGNSLWIEINVVESDSCDNSMAASSIIMPVASASAQQSEHVASTTVHSLSVASTIATDDDISEIGSDGSSVSLISMPSSPSDDEDDALFHDSRSQITADQAHATPAAATATPGSGMDYVMLYDDNSSSEE